uniref:heme-dependent oxidative N-demethylase family protein n=1 Tax=Microbulbifer agarilyticus TaxID=260552 RepID=UPI000255A208|nr:DUF3445 domain-containing protein [Microbulbifer agarilyticus]
MTCRNAVPVTAPTGAVPREILARRYAQDFAEPSACLPFLKVPDIVHMGLNKLEPRAWITPCSQLPHYLNNKTAAYHRLGEQVYAQLPESIPAQREFAELLFRHLIQEHSGYVATATGTLAWRGACGDLHWPGVTSVLSSGTPLRDAGRWIADDVCLLLPGEDGYRLVAAYLAAPSYWRLEEKIGRPLNQIHAPVPGFRDKLAAQMARFFDHLKPEYSVWRSNWSVVDSPLLLQRGGMAPGLDEEVGAESVRSLYLRIERQSLRRLPNTGAVVFTIRVMINPLEDLLALEDGLGALASAVAQMSPAEGRYKSLAPLLPSLQQFFSRHLEIPSA